MRIVPDALGSIATRLELRKKSVPPQGCCLGLPGPGAAAFAALAAVMVTPVRLRVSDSKFSTGQRGHVLYYVHKQIHTSK
jgi:hypothetical protein